MVEYVYTVYIYIYDGSMVDLCCFFAASPSAEQNFRQHPYEVHSLLLDYYPLVN